MKNLLNNKITLTLACIIVGFIAFVLYNTYKRATSKPIMLDTNITENQNYSKIVLAGGCFWCTEGEFNHKVGVIEAVSGYADSDKPNPTYEETGSDKVKAREAVQVIYDPKIINEKQILEAYFEHIDPTDSEGQFADRGHQYSPAIYYTNDTQKLEAEKLIKKIGDSKKFEKPVAVLVLPYNNFYPAEEYHQDYKDKNPVRYNLYREGSGRNNFIRLHWQDGSTTTTSIFEDSDMAPSDASSNDMSLNNQDSNSAPKINNVNETQSTREASTGTAKINSMNTKIWENFTQEMKDKRLAELTELQRKVTQEEGTERAFSNEYNANKEVGLYVDIVSGEPLFLSKDKYDSGTGWPSFVKPIENDDVTLKKEDGFWSSRTEVRSKIADSHLGHVFDDGPADRDGKRYCMNSAALRFVPLAEMEKEGYGEYVALLK